MITGTYTYIRGTENDDVAALAALYRDGVLRAGLLDGRREPILPTLEELGEFLNRKEFTESAFYTIEDRTGGIRGFCTLRGLNPEARHCEYSLLFLDEADYGDPIAGEATGVMLERAFVRWGLRKVVATCLESESAFRAHLARHGFVSAGVQRDVLHARGRWHNMESLYRSNPQSEPTQIGAPTDAL